MGAIFRKIYSFLISLKLAVVVILSLATISAIGTIVESKYDALTAQKLVYTSIYMYVAMGLLIVNLVFVMVDRLPWKRRHIGFVLAHIGIIVLILGSYVTQQSGLDGTMIFTIGEKERWVSLPSNTDLIAYTTLDGDSFKEAFKSEVDFIKNPPSVQKPYVFNIDAEEIKITDFYPYALREQDVVESELERDGPALKFQLKNERANVLEWIVNDSAKPAEFDMGPAKVILTKGDFAVPTGNALVIIPHKDKEKFNYIVYTASKGGLTKKGVGKIGEAIATGWMGLEFRAFKLYQHSVRKTNYKKLERPTPLSVSAAKVLFRGQEQMLGLNSMLKLFNDESAIILTYGNRRIDIGFEMLLSHFAVGRYPGSAMAQSYESKVVLEDGAEHTISMNEPLKHHGYTFYQASFQENEKGEPTASVLSVNRDPGRWIKYLGTSLILLGAILMFYFKKKLAGSSK